MGLTAAMAAASVPGPSCFHYLMERVKCPAREVSFFLVYKLDKSRLRRGKKKKRSQIVLIFHLDLPKSFNLEDSDPRP